MSASSTRVTIPDPGRAARRAITSFVLRFVLGWAVVLGAVAWFPALDRWAVGQTIASLGFVSRLARLSFSSAADAIQVAGVGMQIVPDCTPLMPTAALAIAVFAFPAPWRWRLSGLLAGAAVLWAYNLVRIFALVPVLRHRPEWFEFIHVYMWQTMTLIVVFALFLLWLGLQSRAAGRSVPRPAEGAGGPR